MTDVYPKPFNQSQIPDQVIPMQFNVGGFNTGSFGKNTVIPPMPLNNQTFPNNGLVIPGYTAPSSMVPIDITYEQMIPPRHIVQDITREEMVLRRILDDVNIQSRIVEHMSPDIFTGLNVNICRAILGHNKQFGKFPTPQEIVSALPDGAPERQQVIKIAQYNVETIEQNVSTAYVKSFFREMLTERVIIESADHIKNNKIDNIVDLVKQLEKAVNFDIEINIGLSALHDMPEILRRLNVSDTAIPSGIDAINELTDISGKKKGGWYRSALSLFMGMPNVGKTILLCNEAAYAYKSGYNVLYVSLEMAEERIHQRIIANVTDTPMGEVASQDPHEILEKYKKGLAPGVTKPGNLIVKKLPTTATVVEVENVLLEVKRTMGIDIDLLVVDYIGIMKPAKRSNSVQNMNMYLMGKEVAEQLRDLVCKYKIAGLTASQFNRDGYSNTQASLKDTAGSAGLNDTADLMITITQDPLLKSLFLFMHTILKSRFGANLSTFLSNVDYALMRVISATNEQQNTYNANQASQATTVELFNGNNSYKAEPKQRVKTDEEFAADELTRSKFNTIKNQDSYTLIKNVEIGVK